MARNNSSWRLVFATSAILIATALGTQPALAQYTWVNPTTNSAPWADAANWTGGPAGTYPNGVGATALINAPTRTGGSGNFNLTMPMSDVTVGSLTVDNTNHGNNFRSNFTNGGDAFRLIFEDSDGTANYTETMGAQPNPTIANVQYQFLGKVRLNSDFIINQDNYPYLNTGTTFSNLVEGAADKTIIKEGHGGIQFNYNQFPTETPFQGDVIINQGGIRLISVNPFINVSGITVNSGGQLMLADNGNNTSNTNWTLAPGAVLNLNGPGKATDITQTVINPDGALRFTLGQIGATSFDSPVMLQSDSVISVINPAPPNPITSLTATITEAVTGPGGLTKHGSGTLVLGSAGNDYDGNTTILANGGTLSIANPFLNDAADVFLNTGGVFNLNFSGSDTIRSLYVDGVAQAPGTYGAADLGGLLITGSGTLTVTSLPGLTGDYNTDGIVDAADYVIWRKTDVGGPQGYDDWRANFGDSLPGSGSGSLASAGAVPEPTAWLLAAVSLGVVGLRRSR
jgi:autotransporter-associated beta strand protein